MSHDFANADLPFQQSSIPCFHTHHILAVLKLSDLLKLDFKSPTTFCTSASANCDDSQSLSEISSPKSTTDDLLVLILILFLIPHRRLSLRP
jgi:hypothetical protein